MREDLLNHYPGEGEKFLLLDEHGEIVTRTRNWSWWETILFLPLETHKRIVGIVPFGRPVKKILNDLGKDAARVKIFWSSTLGSYRVPDSTSPQPGPMPETRSGFLTHPVTVTIAAFAEAK